MTIRASAVAAPALLTFLALIPGHARGTASIHDLEPWEAGALARVDTLRLATRGEDALSLITRLLPTARPRSRYLLALRLREGELTTSIGHPRAGEEILRPALDLAWSLGDTARACAVMRWLAVAVGGQGRIEESAALCRRLVEIARGREDRRYEGWGLIGLAWAAEQDGRLIESMSRYEEAARVFREAGDPRSESWARNGLGSVRASAGAYGDARENFAEAAALARATGYRMVEALAANNLGTLEYGLGDPGIAASWFSRAAEIHRSLGEARIALFPMMNLAMCDAQLGRCGEASDTLQALLTRCRREGYGGNEEAGVLRNLADVRDLQGRHHEADRLRREILTLPSRPPLWSRIEAAIGIATSLAARDSAVAAVDLLERTRSDLPAVCDPEVRIQLETALGRIEFGAGRSRQALDHLQAADRLASKNGLTGRRIDPLAWSGRAWRALGRADSARSTLQRGARIWESERKVPLQPEWRERRGLAGRLICTDLADLVLESDGVAAGYETAQRFKSRTLLERMDPSAVALSDTVRGAGGVVPLDRLRETLREGEILLDFYLGPDRSLLFAITRDSCRAVSLAADSVIESQARLYHLLLARPPSSSAARDVGESGPLRDAGRTLRRALLGDVEDLIRRSRSVLICPDGAVNLVPFAAFDDGMRTWTRLPSASILVLLRSRSRAEGDGRGSVLAVASRNGTLPWASREVVDLDRAYRDVDPRLVAGSDTVRVGDLSGARVLHLAGHVEVNDERPWRSAVAIGACGLSAEAIARARTGADLAFLSGCRSMQSRVLSGEGALGLSSALLSAGASCVVGTLWQVEDRATARFVRRFYRELAGGSDVATSLRRSQEALKADGETSHPFYWAAFVPIGAGEVRIPLRSRPDSRWILCLLAGGTLGVGVYLARGRVIRGRRSRLNG